MIDRYSGLSRQGDREAREGHGNHHRILLLPGDRLPPSRQLCPHRGLGTGRCIGPTGLCKGRGESPRGLRVPPRVRGRRLGTRGNTIYGIHPRYGAAQTRLFPCGRVDPRDGPPDGIPGLCRRGCRDGPGGPGEVYAHLPCRGDHPDPLLCRGENGARFTGWSRSGPGPSTGCTLSISSPGWP